MRVYQAGLVLKESLNFALCGSLNSILQLYDSDTAFIFGNPKHIESIQDVKNYFLFLRTPAPILGKNVPVVKLITPPFIPHPYPHDGIGGKTFTYLRVQARRKKTKS